MDYLTKHKGISGKGLQRIAKEVGVPTRKRSQDLSGEVQRWADVILDAIYDTLESVPSDVPSDMVLRTVYDSLAIHAIPSITKTQGSKKSPRRRKAQEGEDEMLSLEDEYAIDPDMLETLMSWHGGQGSDVYALGSSLYAGNEVPKSIAEGALWELERVFEDMKGKEDSEGYDELAGLIDRLSYWINPY